MIAGYLDSTAHARSVGAFVLGYYERGYLIYTGRVGTGFDSRSARALWKQFKPLRIEDSPIANPLTHVQRRGVCWVKTRLVAQIEYRAWTGDDLLRHASFKGIREDKRAVEVHRPVDKTLGSHRSKRQARSDL